VISFEIDGVEYTAEITHTDLPKGGGALAFLGPDGSIYWLHRPVRVPCGNEIDLGETIACTLRPGHEGLHENDGIRWGAGVGQ
jgi:hypothetical protein